MTSSFTKWCFFVGATKFGQIFFKCCFLDRVPTFRTTGRVKFNVDFIQRFLCHMAMSFFDVEVHIHIDRGVFLFLGGDNVANWSLPNSNGSTSSSLLGCICFGRLYGCFCCFGCHEKFTPDRLFKKKKLEEVWRYKSIATIMMLWFVDKSGCCGIE